MASEGKVVLPQITAPGKLPGKEREVTCLEKNERHGHVFLVDSERSVVLASNTGFQKISLVTKEW